MLAFINALSPWHLLVIGVVMLLLFGNRLPEVARSLGRAVNEFKRGLKDVKDQFDAEVSSDDTPREKLQAPPKSDQVSKLEPDDVAREPSESHESRPQ